MRNRAKCKLCSSVIESFTSSDFVECECKEIAVCGGTTKYECYANNFDNFIRIDDLDKEVATTVVDKYEDVKPLDNPSKASRNEVVFAVKEMISNYEKMPADALLHPVTGYDMLSLLFVLLSFLQAED